MNYRWRKVVVSKQAVTPSCIYEVKEMPTTLWRKKLFHIGVWIARQCGVNLRYPVVQYEDVFEFTEETEKKLETALMSKLSEYQLRSLYLHECMIVVGSEEMNAIMRAKDASGAFVVSMRTTLNEIGLGKAGYELMAHYIEVPIYYVHDFVGIAILPDLTGSYVHRIDNAVKS